MIAPEPFFEPRGTPFSEYHRIRALLELGHTVDLVTYPFGSDVSLPGLRVFRCLRPAFVRDVRIGPSLAKVPLDLLLALTALRRAASERYDAVHSHEEGSYIGVPIAKLLGLPHLYDMHSSLPQQLTNFAFSRSRMLARLFTWMERFVVRRSRVVVVICPHLQDVVRAIEPAVPAVLIENAPGSGDTPIAGSGARVRAELGYRARRADRPVYRHLRGLPGSRSPVRGGQARRRRASGRAVRARGRPAGTDRRGSRHGRTRRPRRRGRVCRAARRPKTSRSFSMPPTCWSRRAASAPTRR